MDTLSKVVYHDRAEVPEIKEEEYEQEYDINSNNFITHHNTHQESERIRREYSRIWKINNITMK